jgi:hypothetical protein
MGVWAWMRWVRFVKKECGLGRRNGVFEAKKRFLYRRGGFVSFLRIFASALVEGAEAHIEVRRGRALLLVRG